MRERDRLVLELPETFDRGLIPESRYRLEAQMVAIAELKLVERLGVAPPAEEAVDAETDVQKELGCVDISPQPDKRGGEVEEAEVVATKLVEAREAAPVVLELIEKALDEVPLFVQLAVILRLLFAVSLG